MNDHKGMQMKERTYNICFVAVMFILFIVAGAMVSGCTSQTHAPPTTQQVADELALDVSDAVGASIVFANDPAARARRIEAAAQDIKRVAQSNVDISDLRNVTLEIVLKRVNPDDRAAARFFVNLAVNRVKRHLGITSVTIIPADKIPVVRRLLITAADAAIESASGYMTP